jgi:hypothetical protein
LVVAVAGKQEKQEKPAEQVVVISSRPGLWTLVGSSMKWMC